MAVSEKYYIFLLTKGLECGIIVETGEIMIKTHTFNDKNYRIILDNLDGNCDTDDYLWLIVERDLSKRVGLETVIHEALHACNWPAKEGEVTVTAHDIARFLWRLGYRKVH